MLREPEPPAISAYLTGMWHYARGTAFLGKGQIDSADQEFTKLDETMADKSLDQPLFSPNTGRMVLSPDPFSFQKTPATQGQQHPARTCGSAL